MKKQRQFVPENFRADDAESVKKLYTTLLSEDIPLVPARLRDWILRWSELDCVLAEVSARRYVAMTCNTADEKIAKAYSDFIGNIEPLMSDYSDKLCRKMMAHPTLSALEGEFGTWFRKVRVDLELFRKENIPLQTEETQDVQAYQKITAAMSVQDNGETKTLQQMSAFLESPDRNRREEVWKKITERRLQDKDALDDAFEKLFRLRVQIAKNAGCRDYIDFIFKDKYRFDYTPAKCREFHESIEKIVLPLLREIYKRRAAKMKLAELRPWDLACDELSRPPLRPFKNGEELISKCGEIFGRLNPSTAAWFSELQKQKLIDPESRIGKAPGGYQIGFEESSLPFIFMNAAGTDGDIYTLLHESGHSFHQFAMADQPIIAYRDIPSEFAEVASMSMELIGSTDLTPFYSKAADAHRSRANELSEIVWLFPWVASIDSFQHELYSRPGHTRGDRKQIWLSVMDRYDAGVDYSGLEDARAYLWQKQLHIFEVPFYYVEYGIAQLGALQVWARFRKDPEKALNDLFKAESLGCSRPLPELFSAAGIQFDFSPKTIEPLVSDLWDELSKLS